MNKTVLIVVIILGIIAGAAYWYYYQAPTQTAIEEGGSTSTVSGEGAPLESDTGVAINQDIQNVDLNGSGTDFQEIDNSLNNL